MKNQSNFLGHSPALNDNEKGVRSKPAAASVELHSRFEAATEVVPLSEPFFFPPMFEGLESMEGQK
jgi:hypothetical protein